MSKFMSVITGIVVLLLLSGFAYLFLTTNTVNANQLNEHLLLEAELHKTTDRYVKCYNSVNYGEVMVGKVRMSYLTYESTPEQDATSKQAEQSFLDSVKQDCSSDINKYESTYESYKKLGAELEADSTWKTYLVGGQNFSIDGSKLAQYEPQQVRFFTGNSFTNFTFTEDQVKQYFKDRLGY